MPTISVIVPSRKRHDLLQRALKSLFVQSFEDFEIVVVDDNPPESLVTSCKELIPLLRHPKIRIIRNSHPRNAAAARNCGLQVAAGDWITYLDDDDAYAATKLEKQFLRARETGWPLGLCGMSYRLAGRRRYKQTTCDSFSGDELLLATLPDTKAIFHRRTDVLFNANLDAGEDAYYFFALLKHFKMNCVFNVPEPLVEVFYHSRPRVNRNADALLSANRAIQQDFGSNFSKEAVKLFGLRTELQHYKFRDHASPEMARVSLALVRLRGIRELRLILNVWLYRVPGLRRFLI